MIVGVVSNREAVVQIDIVQRNGKTYSVDVIVDTGFTGELTLPHLIIESLDLAAIGRGDGTLADGKKVDLD